MTPLQPTVFLDIDGVLCPNSPYGGRHVYNDMCRWGDAAPDLYERLFAAEAIEVLNELVKQFKPRFVLTTTWLALLDRHHFVYVFGRCGLGQVASSLHERWDAPANRGVTRFEAIKRWLEQHHHGEAILVLDDVESGESLRGTSLETAGRVVLCDVDGCLRHSHLEAARSALRRPIYHAATNLTLTELLQGSDENRHDLHFDRRSATGRRDGAGSVVAPAKFAPNERQKKFIRQAIEEAKKANLYGHRAPDELVARMTAEGSFVANPPPSDHASAEFRFVLAAAIDEPLTSRELEERLHAPPCTSAAVFKAPRHVMLLEFSQQATTLDAAMTDAVKNVLRAFPQADFLDLNDQNALLDELVEASDGRSPTESELRKRPAIPS